MSRYSSLVPDAPLEDQLAVPSGRSGELTFREGKPALVVVVSEANELAEGYGLAVIAAMVALNARRVRSGLPPSCLESRQASRTRARLAHGVACVQWRPLDA